MPNGAEKGGKGEISGIEADRIDADDKHKSESKMKRNDRRMKKEHTNSATK